MKWCWKEEFAFFSNYCTNFRHLFSNGGCIGECERKIDKTEKKTQ